jgi:hypothetical protein
VQLKTQAVMKEAQFFSVTCDEVTILDTQSWISIHGYVCENWTRKSMLLSLEQVVEGGGADSLTKVIVNAIKTSGGVEEAELTTRLASFGQVSRHKSLRSCYILFELILFVFCNLAWKGFMLWMFVVISKSFVNLGCFFLL